jgi:hypothetical protein
MSETLKPCPHCGSANVHLSYFDNSKVFCASCFGSNNARKWNTRPREDALRAALKHIASYPIHSEPMGGAYDMRDIAEKALNETQP